MEIRSVKMEVRCPELRGGTRTQTGLGEYLAGAPPPPNRFLGV